MIRLMDEGLWTKCEVVHEMTGTERAHPKHLVAFGIPELHSSDRLFLP